MSLTSKQKAILDKIPPENRQEFVQKLTQRLSKISQAKNNLIQSAKDLPKEINPRLSLRRQMKESGNT